MTAAITLAQSSQQILPDAVLYKLVFFRIVKQKQFGDHLDAQGKNSLLVRSELRSQIGLTAAEYAILESAALDYESHHLAYLQQRGALFAAAKANKAAGKPIDPSIGPTLASLAAQDTATLQTELGKLGTALGDRFQLLNSFARTKILPAIAYKQTSK